MSRNPPVDEYEQMAARAQDRVKKLIENEGAQVDALLDRIAKQLGLATTKWFVERWLNKRESPLFEEQKNGEPARFVLPPEEQKRNKAATDSRREQQQARTLVTLPRLEQIAAADRQQICMWWYKWPARNLSNEERLIHDALWRRYVELGGYPEDFDPKKLTPTKKRGAVSTDVLRLYEEAKAKHGGKLTMLNWATRYAKGHPKKRDSVYRKLMRQKKVRTLRLPPLD